MPERTARNWSRTGHGSNSLLPAGAGQPSLCILGAASWIKSVVGAAASVESDPFGAVLAAFTLRGVQEIELWPVVVNISI